MQDDTTRTDLGVAADLNIAEHFCPSTQQHAVTHLRVPIATLLAGAAERHLVQDRNVIADNRSLADNETGTVVDEHAASDRYGGMDIDGKDFGDAALQEMRKLSPTIAPQPMADTVSLQRVEAFVV